MCNRSADLCGREPVHLSSAIQPHGVLVGLRPRSLSLVTKSANVDAIFGDALPGKSLSWLPPTLIANCRELGKRSGDGPALLTDIPGLGLTEAHCFAASGLAFCEFELPAATAFALEGGSLIVAQAIKDMEAAQDLFELADVVARSMRAVSGFERVMVYRFELDGDGEVVGESLVEDWDQSFMGLRFPASDIPPQARVLYSVSHQRWIPAGDYTPVPLVPKRNQRGEPFDLSFSLYRSISPVHQAYQHNIGADGAMSLSILCDGALWGLVIGHHRRSHRVSAQSRHDAAAIVRAFNIALGRLARSARAGGRRGLPSHSTMLAKLAVAEECLSALTEGEPSIVDLLPGCAGAAVVWTDNGASQVRTLAETPPPDDIAALALWVRSSAKESVFSCDCISDHFSPFLAHREKASGVLALLFEDDRQPVLLLFRPEVIRSVSWAGKPEKLAEPNGSLSLPRRSFELWIEAKRSHSDLWRPGELDIAADLLATVNFVLVQESRRLRLKEAEQIALAASREKIEFLTNNRKLAAQNRALAAAKAATEASNRELEAFSYSVAHDLRSPLRSVDGFCEILEEEYADRLDETGRDYLGRVRRAAQRMGTLIDDLLRLARITQGGLSLSMVNLSHIAAEIREELQHGASGRHAEFMIAPDIVASGDARLLRVVLENLFSNAWKFTATQPVARIEFGSEPMGGQTVLFVRDNGVGFDMAYAGRLFGAFQRLHGAQEFPGTGIGLATVQRIVNKHGGRIWADAALGKGATFRFTLSVAGDPHLQECS